MLLQKMQEMKDETKMTYQDISDKSGVPLSTVKRIFSGQTPDPGYTSVISIIEAMGGSDDDIKQSNTAQSNNSVPRQSVERLCSVYEHSIADKNKLIKALLVIILAMMSVFIFLLVWDLCNPNIGFFR